MKIQKLTVKNILGIELFELNLGKFTLISGPNHSNKTNVLEAIKSVFKGGHDATLLRNGADKGEVVLELDDGRSIKESVDIARSKVDLRDVNGRIIGKISDVKELVDLFSVNPLSFLTEKPEKRVKILLESMPIYADPAKIEKLCDMSVPPNLPAFECIDDCIKVVYDNRQDVNRDAKSKKATIDQLRTAKPVQSVSVDVDAVKQEIQKHDAAKDALISKIDVQLQRETDVMTSDVDAINKTCQEKVEELQNQISLLRATAENDVQKKREALQARRDAAKEAKQKAINVCATAKEDLQANLDAYEQFKEQEIKFKHVQELINSHDAEVIKLDQESKQCTETIDSLNDYKMELLKSLPIKGLSFKNGEFFFDDVTFDRLNDATKISIAIELAKIRAGELGVVCVDGIERLDSKMFEEFARQAVDSGLQFIATEVDRALTEMEVKNYE